MFIVQKHVWDQLFTVDTIWNIGETGDIYPCFFGKNQIEINQNLQFQVNPFSQGMYQTLEEIYDEYQDIFRFDSFHMGGDEVSSYPLCKQSK